MSVGVDTNRLRGLVDRLCEARASGKMPSTIFGVLAEHELRAALSELDHLRTEQNIAAAAARKLAKQGGAREGSIESAADGCFGRLQIRSDGFGVTTDFLEGLMRLKTSYSGKAASPFTHDLIRLLIDKEQADIRSWLGVASAASSA